ncbi:MAG TPA: non-homologous end-joining DNA ligase [Gaiellaceae bacterium]|nr:non-homologous end-joining DNA ligase [Gaiellaceae bacterium]
MTSLRVELEGRAVTLTNLGKVLWPEAGFTKEAMLEYYAHVAPTVLPHVAGRPLTLRRFPDGVDGANWYQTECRGRPDWLPVQRLPHRTRGAQELCVVNDLPALLWVANQASIELHPFLAFGDRPDEPTVLVLDLDPGPPADVLACCRVALRLRGLLAEAGLSPFVKTSGSVGLHVYVPLNTPHTYADTKAFARTLARLLASEDPDGVTDRMQRSLRPGKVLVDWLQNDPTRSTVAPYSLRATAWPTVSTPVTWEEIERAASTGRAELLTFEPAAVLARVEEHGDLFAPVLELEQTLPR